MEGILILGWDPILPGCRWLHEAQTISDLPDSGVGGFHAIHGGIEPVSHCFPAKFVRLVDVCR